MPFISDSEALKLSERYLSAEQHAEFCQRLEKMRHFEECVETSTPSPHCKHADPAKNLEWCRLGLRIEGAAFEDLLQEILLGSTANQGLTVRGGTARLKDDDND